MKKILNGKVVVITGASSGIGEAMAREYAKMGAKVVMGARREEELQRIAQEIKAAGGDVAYAACDVVNEEECKHLMDVAVEKFGGIDILICNAGLSMRALFDECDLKVLHRLMDVNSITISGEPMKHLSVFPFGCEAHGVSILGAEYECEDITLTPSFPLAASNRFLSTDVKISVKDGTLLVMKEF